MIKRLQTRALARRKQADVCGKRLSSCRVRFPKGKSDGTIPCLWRIPRCKTSSVSGSPCRRAVSKESAGLVVSGSYFRAATADDPGNFVIGPVDYGRAMCAGVIEGVDYAAGHASKPL